MKTAYVKEQKNQRYKAIILLAITAILWSTGGILIKMVDWNPIAISGVRSIIAALIILIALKKPRFKLSFNMVGGAVVYAATLIFFVTATKMTTAANAILLQYTAPIYVALFGAWFLGEKTTWIDWITIFCVFGSMILFFIDHIGTGGLLGNIFAILSGVCFAGVAMFMRKQKHESPLESILLGNIFIAVFAIPFMFKSMPDAKSWMGMLILGVVQIGIPYILYSIAIKHVTALEAVLIPVLEPVLNPLWVFIFIGEAPGLWALIGGGLVLFFITLRCAVVAVKGKSPAGEEAA